MNVRIHDHENASSPMNGRTISTPKEVLALFQMFDNRPAFIFDMIGENGFKLTIGYSDSVGFVQHATVDAQPPYMVAVNEAVADEDVFVEFLSGGTPTPISSRFCLPARQVVAIAQEFVATGSRLSSVVWEDSHHSP